MSFRDRPNHLLPPVSDPFANAQLELCCRIGSVDGVLEALEDGADINGNAGAALFTAIMAGERAIISVLVEKGADVSLFQIGASDHEAIVEALLALAPAPASEESAAGADDPVDAKRVKAFDKMIRSKGLGEPFRKGRGDEYPSFRTGLAWIAAEECEACVGEFLALRGDGEEGAGTFLEANAARISELSARYLAAPEVPVDLLKDYLKEKK